MRARRPQQGHMILIFTASLASTPFLIGPTERGQYLGFGASVLHGLGEERLDLVHKRRGSLEEERQKVLELRETERAKMADIEAAYFAALNARREACRPAEEAYVAKAKGVLDEIETAIDDELDGVSDLDWPEPDGALPNVKSAPLRLPTVRASCHPRPGGEVSLLKIAAHCEEASQPGGKRCP
jgi:hypothetical protein